MTFSREQLEEMARSASWFHSIDLGNGVVTKGIKSAAQLEHELQAFRLPDVRDKTVLDIGAWDGYFSFAAERLGAKHVLALDHYAWSLDLHKHFRYLSECKERGIVPKPYHETAYWQPDELPGKRGFDTARQALGSHVDGYVGDFMEMDLDKLGAFDIVFYFGVLYHMQNPLEALKRLAAVTRQVAIIETEATAFPGYERHAVCQFFPTNELDGDVSNWWAPNQRALEGMCRAAGFRRVETLAGSPVKTAEGETAPSDPVRYRAVVHAWK